MQKTKRFGVSIEENLINKFDSLIKRQKYPNRSEAIRNLIRNALVKQEWNQNQEAVGTITLVYDHHKHDLQHELTHAQHNYHKYILSAMHVHLDHDNCLEVLVVKGKAKEIKAISDRIGGIKGIKHSKLVGTTTGKELS